MANLFSGQAWRSISWGPLLVLAGCAPAPTLSLAEKSSAPAPTVRTALKPPEPEVALQVVKYQQLTEAVKALKGKVVVVDIWAEY